MFNRRQKSVTDPDILRDGKEGLATGAFIGGIIIGVLGGLGFAIGLCIFFIGAAIKLLTANIW